MLLHRINTIIDYYFRLQRINRFPRMMAQPVMLAFKRLRQEDDFKLETRLGYIVNFRTAWVTECDPV